MFSRSPKKLLSLCLLLSALSLGVSDCSTLIDPAMSAAKGNDPTVVLRGCGNNIQDIGYVFCRVSDRSSGDQHITLIVPKVSCSRSSCAEFQVWLKDGTPGFSGGIPKGETDYELSLTDIINHGGEINLSDDGEYLVTVRLFFNVDGNEMTTVSKGYVRLVVLTEGYSAAGCSSPHRVWKHKISNKCYLETTTGYRSAICGECE